MRELGLFAGAGGGLLASNHLLGWRTVCAVEIEPYCQGVLRQRQADGALPAFPIWDDVCTFDGKPWRRYVDVVSGGFPCQDISSAGRGAGLDGARSSLWFEMLRIIGEVRPAFIFAENSPNLRTRGLDRIISGLADLGYCCAWGVLGAWHVGAPHRRNRMWIVAAHPDRCREREQSEHAEVVGAPHVGETVRDANCERIGCAQHEQAERSSDARYATDVPSERRGQGWARGLAGSNARQGTETTGRALVADASSTRREITEPRRTTSAQSGIELCGGREWWDVRRFAGVDDGLAYRVERVRATGNGQVPAVAALAWRTLAKVLDV